MSKETTEPQEAESKTDEREAGEVTRLLSDWRGGDGDALERLMPIVYEELRQVAQRNMSFEQGSTLQATALVNEAYLRLVNMEIPWEDRVHFFAVAAGLMRRILVDRARRRRAAKRGGGAAPVVLTDIPGETKPVEDMLALDEALKELETFDTRKSRILELRYFGGLSVVETAEAMELSKATVEREIKSAKAWVLRRLRDGAR